MKALRLEAWHRPAVLREVPILEPGPGEVLIQVGGVGAWGCRTGARCPADLENYCEQLAAGTVEGRAVVVPNEAYRP